MPTPFQLTRRKCGAKSRQSEPTEGYRTKTLWPGRYVRDDTLSAKPPERLS